MYEIIAEWKIHAWKFRFHAWRWNCNAWKWKTWSKVFIRGRFHAWSCVHPTYPWKFLGRNNHARGDVFIFMHGHIIKMKSSCMKIWNFHAWKFIFMHESFMPQFFHAWNFFTGFVYLLISLHYICPERSLCRITSSKMCICLFFMLVNISCFNCVGRLAASTWFPSWTVFASRIWRPKNWSPAWRRSQKSWKIPTVKICSTKHSGKAHLYLILQNTQLLSYNILLYNPSHMYKELLIFTHQCPVENSDRHIFW